MVRRLTKRWLCFSIPVGVLFLLAYSTMVRGQDDSRTHIIRHLNAEAGLRHDEVYSVIQDQQGYLWVGTLNGLNKLDPRTTSIKKYFQADGLLSDTVYGILCDDGRFIWLSSNRGLSRLNPDSGEVRNYRPSAGLQSSIFKRGACFRDNAGTLYFGGLNGVNEFNPSKIVDSAGQPPVVLTALEINNKSIGDLHLFRQKDGLDLPYNENNLFFEFAALDFTNPNQNRFTYYLAGFDNGWHKAGTRRSASYTNLEPGRYVFSIRATNSDGIWNEPGISLAIRISSPFWATSWFRILAGLAVFSLLLSLHFTRVSANKIKERELQKQVNDRTALLEQANCQLKKLADSDGLTGIANHRRFHELLFEEWRRPVRTQAPQTGREEWGGRPGNSTKCRQFSTVPSFPDRQGAGIDGSMAIGGRPELRYRLQRSLDRGRREKVKKFIPGDNPHDPPFIFVCPFPDLHLLSAGR